ncbi:MAG: MFS transporter [Patescibacteria group bacterium]
MEKQISPRNNFVYILTTTIDSMAFIIPIIIIYLQGKVTVAQVSFLFAFRYFVQLVAELPTGALSDLLGKKLTITLGFFINSFYFLLLFFSQNFYHFLIAYFLGGIGDSLLSGSTEALVYDSLKQDRLEKNYPKVLVKQNIFFQIGLVIGTIAGGFLYTVASWLPFAMCGLFQFLNFIFSFFYIEPYIDTVKFTIKNYLNQINLGVKEIFKNPHAALVSWYYIAVGGITWTCAMFFNSYMLVDLGFSNEMRGIIEGLLRLLNIFIISLFVKNEKLFTKKNSFLFFPIVMLIAFLPGRFLYGIIGIPFVAFSMIAATARFVFLNKYTNEEYDSRYRATALSALSMFVGIIYVAIITISGPIIANFGGMRTMYTLLGVLTLITVVPLARKIVKTISL